MQENEQYFRSIFDSVNDAIFVLDPATGKILDVNKKMCEMYGFSRAEALQAEIEDLSSTEPPYTRQDALTWMKKAAEREPKLIQWRAKDKSGRLFWVEVNMRRAAIEGQNRLIIAAREISERKRAEESLRESEERYRQLFELVSEAILLIDNETGRILEANSTASALYGYNHEELLTKKNTELSAEPEDTRRITRTTPPAADKIVTVPLRFHRKKDGTVFPVEIDGRFFVRQGRPVHIAAIHDISERIKTEKTLRESEARYRALVESQVDLVSRYLPDTTLTFVNDAYCQFFGKTREELIGHSYMFMIAPEFRDLVFKETQNIANNPGPIAGEYLNIRRDGQECWIQWVIHGIADENGQVVEIQATGRDITRLKRAEAEIHKLNDDLERRVVERTAQLEAAVKELEAFTYSVSHDLRAPLRSMDGYAHILTEDYGPSLDAEGRRVCATIHDNALRMSRLIDDLLAFSRLGRIELRASQIHMETLAGSVFKELTTRESRDRIDFRLTALPMATGDPTLIRQVWMNLLSNAVKFSSKRERAVIEVDGKADEKEIVYSVRDNGDGFDAKYARKLFGVFQRLHSEKEFAGTGVGLAIVSRVITRHGGRVWAEGETGKGAVFYFSLPLAHAPPPPAAH